MRKYFNIFNVIILLAAATAVPFWNGCTDDPAASVFNPNTPTAPAPVITAITVEGGGGLLSGVSTVVIDGKNFSSDSSKVIVFFDAVRATLLSTTATQIKVKAPTIVKDSVIVRVSVLGAESFSAIKTVNISAAVSLFGNFTTFEEAYGIACDQSGNLYTSMLSSGLGIGIRKYTPSGDTSTYAPKGSETNWSALKIGPGGKIFSCRTQFAIFTFDAGEKSTVYKSIPGSKLYDLDFDKNLNIWSGGAADSIYRIMPDKSAKGFFFSSNANVRSVRIYNDFLYLGGKVDSLEGVWRSPIDGSGNVGIFTKYFDLSAQPGYGFNGPGVFAITFNTDGEMYVGTNGKDGILIVTPSSPSTATPLFPGLFAINAENYAFAWGEGSTLNVTRRSNGIPTILNILVKINTQKQSAPYYGRGDL